MSLKDLGYKPRRTTVRIVLDDTVRQELEDARAALRAEKGRVDRGLDSAPEQRVEEAEAAAEEAAVSFVFQAVPRRQYEELVEALPPTQAQLEQWKEQDRNNPFVAVPPPAYDYTRFAPRLIAASLVEPETTEEEVVELWEEGDWSESVWDKLYDAAKEVNEKTTTLPTSGIGSRKTQASDPESPTQ